MLGPGRKRGKHAARWCCRMVTPNRTQQPNTASVPVNNGDTPSVKPLWTTPSVYGARVGEREKDASRTNSKARAPANMSQHTAPAHLLRATLVKRRVPTGGSRKLRSCQEDRRKGTYPFKYCGAHLLSRRPPFRF